MNGTKSIFQIPSACSVVTESVIEIRDKKYPENTLQIRIPSGVSVGSYFIAEYPTEATGQSDDVMQEPTPVSCCCNVNDPQAAIALITKQRISTDAFDCIRGILPRTLIDLPKIDPKLCECNLSKVSVLCRCPLATSLATLLPECPSQNLVGATPS